MNSVSQCSCTEAVEALLHLVNAQEPILDCTYGSGNFWVGSSRQEAVISLGFSALNAHITGKTPSVLRVDAPLLITGTISPVESLSDEVRAEMFIVNPVMEKPVAV